MKIGIWEEFTKEDQKTIRKSLRGINEKGLATPEELIAWTKRVIMNAIAEARSAQAKATRSKKRG